VGDELTRDTPETRRTPLAKKRGLEVGVGELVVVVVVIIIIIVLAGRRAGASRCLGC
jgi:hypothetical protein